VSPATTAWNILTPDFAAIDIGEVDDHRTVVESLPRSSRSGVFGILYAISIAVFGGFTQFIIKWLIDVTGSPLAPGWYLSVALIVGGVAMILLPESAPCTNPDRRDDS
jgi:hypothetical protein